ncbi:MAG: ComF family protein [Bacteroidia bacterium]|nr:ComF family protein [Bacteroidia bacterium]
MHHYSLLSAFRDAIRCISPSLCQICGEALVYDAQIVCLSCEEDLPVTSFHMQKDNPFTDKFFGRINLQAGASYLYFTKEGIAQKLVHQLKYKGKTKLGTSLGQRYGHVLKESSLFKNIDLIMPVPLHRKRLRSRGYNQSSLFAKGISETMDIPMDSNNVIRHRATKTQTRKTRLERFQNVDGAFRVLDPKQLEYKNVLLVDDILTTGATLEGCSKELLKIPGLQLSMATIGFAYFQ